MSDKARRRLAVATFLAKHIAKQATVDDRELAEAISEVELETQIEGAPFIKVHLIDPYYRLLTSGFVEVVNERLNDIQVEFPEGSNWWWQLVAVEVTNDLSQPNLVLVFEDRIVAELREVWGHKIVSPGTQTRAQFVKALVDECNLKLRHEGKPPIRFVCPSLNVLQEVEESTSEKTETLTGKNELGQTTLTSKDKKSEHARANKSPAIGKGAELKVKGIPMTPEQEEQSDILLGVADRLKAPIVAVEALVFAAIAESDITESAGNGTYWGVLSGDMAYWKRTDSEGMAEAFLKGDSGKGFQGGGAIALSRTSNDPVEIAVIVEGVKTGSNLVTENQYVKEGDFSQFLPEAQAIIAAGGGSFGSLLHGSGSASGESDVGQLSRGTPQDPNEDSWDCILRLASQVRWFAFTNGLDLKTYQRGRFLYYMDGFDFIRQKPAAYLEIPTNKIINSHTGKHSSGVILTGLLGNWDNTAYEYQQTHKTKGKLQRKSRVAKPQTPTELRIPIVCEPLEYESGDVFKIRNSGTFNGRWVIVNTVRKYTEDPYTTITLAPPQLPYPEPSGTSSGAGGQVTGLQAVVEAVERAYAEKAKYQYSEGSDRENNGTLFGASTRTMDCSSFATLAYKEGGMPDPSGMNYSPIGNTASMIKNMVKTSKPVPADLCFYGPDPAYPQHVTVYIGNGSAIGMERPGVNLLEGPVEELGPKPFIGYYRLKGEYATELHK